METKHEVAFALGGLAGNNAHGAGFLQAALEKGIKPAMISCTSGQVRWAYRYLESLDDGTARLREQLEEDIEQTRFFDNKDLDFLKLVGWGLKGVYRPAYLDLSAQVFRNWLNFCQTAQDYWADFIPGKSRPSLVREFFRLAPAHFLGFALDPGTLDRMSKRFNDSPIGISFNSYNAGNGREYVYLNHAARDLLTRDGKGDRDRYARGKPDTWRDRIIYQDITPEAVRDALWLYYYGFDQKENSSVDGAYFREIMLSELTFADRIYVVRPVHFHWVGPQPTSFVDVEDFKTRLNFNGSYAGERYQIRLINKLIAEGLLGPNANDAKARNYHPIDLFEIEIEKPRDVFDYVFEDPRVFDGARDKALQAFEAGKN